MKNMSVCFQNMSLCSAVLAVCLFATAYAIQQPQLNATSNLLSRDLGNLFSLEKRDER